MKLISNLDVNGNKFINGELTLQMPAVTGTKTIATHEEVMDVITQFGGAFQFKGEAIRIKETEGVKDYTTIIVAGEGTTEVEVKAATANRGNVYQIGDKEFASNGSLWVELGFNIDLSAYDKTASAEAREAILDGKISTNANAISGLDGRLTTAEGNIATAKSDIDALEGRMDTAEENITTLQGDLEEAEEVTSAALNDLNSRANGLATRMTAAESAIETLGGDAVKSVAIGENTAIGPDENGKVTLPAATNSVDGYMTAADHTKLSGIEPSAQVNIIESVKVDGTALTITDKAVNIDLATPLSGKVDKVTGKQLSTEDYTTAEKTKLGGIEAGAEVNVINGVILSDSQAALSPDANRNVTIPNATPGTNGTDGADGLMSSEDKFKLNSIAAGAEVNVQADWSVTDTASDAYIANKPTNLAATYLYEPSAEQYAAKTVTIAATAHKCGLFPLVQVYYGMDVVSANVSVVVNQSNHDVTVSWEVAADSVNPIHIRIVG